jgi:hypothetical protein
VSADPVATLTALAAWYREVELNESIALAKHIENVIRRHKRLAWEVNLVGDWVCGADVRELLAVAEALGDRGVMSDPVATLTALAAHYRRLEKAAHRACKGEYRTLAEHVDGVIARHTDQPWRVGQHYGIHVYAGDVPIATFHTVSDARRAVEDHNATDDVRHLLAVADALGITA